jgi:hypothetical protein
MMHCQNHCLLKSYSGLGESKRYDNLVGDPNQAPQLLQWQLQRKVLRKVANYLGMRYCAGPP